MITLGKRPREGFSSSIPGALGSTPGHRSGPQSVPYGSNIPVQNISSQIHTPTNTTASVPLLIKPWRDRAHVEYFPGDIIFTKKDQRGRLQVVSDLAQMNIDLKEEKILPNLKKLHELDNYNFFGVYRNETNVQGSSSMVAGRLHPKKQQMLINIDVYGRSRIANIFGSVKQGDHVGLSLIADVTETVEGKAVVTMQLVPTVNGKGKFFEHKMERRETFEIMSIPIGIVSFTSRPVNDLQIQEALIDRDKMTKLPQIEILML